MSDTQIVLIGKDTLKIDGDIINELGNGVNVEITFPNEKGAIVKGKGNNAIYTKNEQGTIAQMVIRVLRGSKIDKTLNSRILQQDTDFAGFTLVNAEFIKRMGKGNGELINEIYFLSGGIFKNNVAGQSNTDGDAEIGVAVYTLHFRSANRIIA